MNLTFEPGGKFGSSASSVRVVGTGPFCISASRIVLFAMQPVEWNCLTPMESLRKAEPAQR
jgi:hypothetical protein